jgi:hypothetical protein
MRLHGPSGVRDFVVALVDTGADGTLFDRESAVKIGVYLDGDSGWVHWRGGGFAIERGTVTFQISDGNETWSWEAEAGFAANPELTVNRPLLGRAGFLDFMNAAFMGPARVLELDWASSHPCSITQVAPAQE